MVLSCAVVGCKRNSRKNKDHSFFQIPKDRATREKWVEFLGKPDVSPTIRVCSDHFDPRCIAKKHPRPLLVRGAIPTNLRPNTNRNETISTNTDNRPQKTQQTKCDEDNQLDQCEVSKLSKTADIKRMTINSGPSGISQPTEIGQSSRLSPCNEEDKTPISTKTCNETPTHNSLHHPPESPISRLQASSPTKQSPRCKSHAIRNLSLTPKSMRIHFQKRQIAALRSKINRLKHIDNSRIKGKTKSKLKLEQLIRDSAEYLPKESHIMFEAQLRLAFRKQSGKRYDDGLKDISLSILYHSPKAYKFLKKILNLPSERTLRRYQEQFPVYPGVNSTVVAELKDKFQNQPKNMKVVSLLFDEINLVSEVHFDANNDKFVGLADDGSKRQPVAAKSALVAMLTWPAKNMKQVIGYWLIGNRCSSYDTYQLIMPCIDKIHESGLIVKALICDQGPRNYGLVKQLGITPEKPYFRRNDHKIYMIFDPPHLIKSLRNNLIRKKLSYLDGIVDWAQIELVYKLSSECPLNLLPKLTENHFKIDHFTKMRVSLATQVFSESVYTALLVYKTIFPEKFNTENDVTQQFIIDIDKLFDSLNSSLQRSTVPNKLNYAISRESDHIVFLQKMKKNFQSARFEMKPQPACIKGIILTIQAVIDMSLDLIDNYEFKTICTRRLNQDPLENLFAVIRQQHGCTQDPSPMQFQAGLRHTLITNLSKVSSLTNCETDANLVFAKMSSIKNLKPTPDKNNNDALQLQIVDELASNNSDTQSDTREFTESNAIYYIAGYLCKKFLKVHKCTECEHLLILPNDSNYAEHKLFIIMKTYADTHGLLHVTESIFTALLAWEKQYQSIIRQILHATHLTKVVANIFNDTCPQIQLCSPQSSETFMLTYIRIRCHWEARFIRRNLKTKNTQKDNDATAKKMRRFSA